GAVIGVGSPPDDVRILGGRYEKNYTPGAIADSNAINLVGTNISVVGVTFKDNLNINGGQEALSDGAPRSGGIGGIVADCDVIQTLTPGSENTMGIEVDGSEVLVIGNRVKNATGNGIEVTGDTTGVMVIANEVSSTAQNGIATILGGGSVGMRK